MPAMATTLQLPAAATIDQVPALREEWAATLAEAGAGALQVQAEQMQSFDTSTLALLLDVQRTLRQRGGHLVLRGAPAKLIELARLYGIDELLFGRAVSA